MKKENQKYTSNASEHEGWKFSISSQSNIQSADELFARSDNKFSLHLHDLPIAGHETKVQFMFINFSGRLHAVLYRELPPTTST